MKKLVHLVTLGQVAPADVSHSIGKLNYHSCLRGISLPIISGIQFEINVLALMSELLFSAMISSFIESLTNINI